MTDPEKTDPMHKPSDLAVRKIKETENRMKQE